MDDVINTTELEQRLRLSFNLASRCFTISLDKPVNLDWQHTYEATVESISSNKAKDNLCSVTKVLFPISINLVEQNQQRHKDEIKNNDDHDNQDQETEDDQIIHDYQNLIYGNTLEVQLNQTLSITVKSNVNIHENQRNNDTMTNAVLDGYSAVKLVFNDTIKYPNESDPNSFETKIEQTSLTIDTGILNWVALKINGHNSFNPDGVIAVNMFENIKNSKNNNKNNCDRSVSDINQYPNFGVTPVNIASIICNEMCKCHKYLEYLKLAISVNYKDENIEFKWNGHNHDCKRDQENRSTITNPSTSNYKIAQIDNINVVAGIMHGHDQDIKSKQLLANINDCNKKLHKLIINAIYHTLKHNNNYHGWKLTKIDNKKLGDGIVRVDLSPRTFLPSISLHLHFIPKPIKLFPFDLGAQILRDKKLNKRFIKRVINVKQEENNWVEKKQEFETESEVKHGQWVADTQLKVTIGYEHEQLPIDLNVIQLKMHCHWQLFDLQNENTYCLKDENAPILRTYNSNGNFNNIATGYGNIAKFMIPLIDFDDTDDAKIVRQCYEKYKRENPNNRDSEWKPIIYVTSMIFIATYSNTFIEYFGLKTDAFCSKECVGYMQNFNVNCNNKWNVNDHYCTCFKASVEFETEGQFMIPNTFSFSQDCDTRISNVKIKYNNNNNNNNNETCASTFDRISDTMRIITNIRSKTKQCERYLMLCLSNLNNDNNNNGNYKSVIKSLNELCVDVTHSLQQKIHFENVLKNSNSLAPMVINQYKQIINECDEFINRSNLTQATILQLICENSQFTINWRDWDEDALCLWIFGCIRDNFDEKESQDSKWTLNQVRDIVSKYKICSKMLEIINPLLLENYGFSNEKFRENIVNKTTLMIAKSKGSHDVGDGDVKDEKNEYDDTDENGNVSLLCQTCCTNRINTIMYPCGHAVVCQKCSDSSFAPRMTPCPICRALITEIAPLCL